MRHYRVKVTRSQEFIVTLRAGDEEDAMSDAVEMVLLQPSWAHIVENGSSAEAWQCDVTDPEGV